MKKVIVLLCLTVMATNVDAKIWRVNNNAGVLADFNTGPAAVNSAAVLNGDTLYFEASATGYGGIILRKRLVLIGLGYFISLPVFPAVNPVGNIGLQASTVSARIDQINYDSLASGSQVIGLEIGSIYGQTLSAVSPGDISLSAFAADNITLTRCYISGDINLSTGSSYPAYNKADGWKINKCYIGGSAYIYGVNPSNWQITNSMMGQIQMQNPNNYNCLVRNNVIGGVNIYNVYFANNLIGTNTITRVNCTVKNNTSYNYAGVFNDPSDAANGNNTVTPASAVFIGSTIPDKNYQLKPSYESSSLSDGETISGVTPKRGPFATADPYVLSGIPPIPSIYLLTVPASISNAAVSMPITISTRSNN